MIFPMKTVFTFPWHIQGWSTLDLGHFHNVVHGQKQCRRIRGRILWDISDNCQYLSGIITIDDFVMELFLFTSQNLAAVSYFQRFYYRAPQFASPQCNVMYGNGHSSQSIYKLHSLNSKGGLKDNHHVQ